jgi:hypothetical protein
MEKCNFEKDIKVFCVSAKYFPDGITEAWQKLHSMLPSIQGRNFFGISRSEPEAKGTIVYKAAVEESYPGEAEKCGCEIFIIKKGEYVNETLPDWEPDPTLIGKTFQNIISNSGIDPNGYCIEMYLGEHEVKCMVRVQESKD